MGFRVQRLEFGVEGLGGFRLWAWVLGFRI